jgi:hypothetical protein
MPGSRAVDKRLKPKHYEAFNDMVASQNLPTIGEIDVMPYVEHHNR